MIQNSFKNILRTADLPPSRILDGFDMNQTTRNFEVCLAAPSGHFFFCRALRALPATFAKKFQTFFAKKSEGGAKHRPERNVAKQQQNNTGSFLCEKTGIIVEVG